MKTIGMIGGMSWESSLEYYRIINEEVKERLGGLHSAKCIMFSVDFHELEKCMKKDDWGKIAGVLTGAGRSLEAAGADFIILCTNTMHKVSGEIQAGIHIPFLHIADITAQQVLSKGIKTVGLLGTKYTMEQDFYRSRLEAQGIKVLIPEEADRALIDAVIFNELCLGQINEESRSEYKRIIGGLMGQGAEGIILGCTEIGLLVKPEDSLVPLFDTTVVHAEGAVNYALG